MGEVILVAMKIWFIIFGFCMTGSGVTIFVTTLDVERKVNNKKIWDVSLVASLFLTLSGLLILFMTLKNNGV
ncbi:hypothetical protein [Cetobacterium sp.]|uniref:hypothetical protein n=1 Tax=Cetobacterium sp. TaxID=2071632 RepID=UPI003F2F8D37